MHVIYCLYLSIMTRKNKEQGGTEDEEMHRRIAILSAEPRRVGYNPMRVHHPAQPRIRGSPGQSLAAGSDNPGLFYNEYEEIANASQVAGLNRYEKLTTPQSTTARPVGYYETIPETNSRRPVGYYKTIPEPRSAGTGEYETIPESSVAVL